MYGAHTSNAALEGAIVATYSAGNVIGGLLSGFINAIYGRRFALSLSCLLAILGAAVQTGSNGPGMMIAGRVIAGIATGFLLSTMPIYISEISPPKLRGKLVGIQGMIDALGFFAANWVGYGGSFARGDKQWRIPLGMQIPAAGVLLVLTQFLPQSPRWCMGFPCLWKEYGRLTMRNEKQWRRKTVIKKPKPFSSDSTTAKARRSCSQNSCRLKRK